VSRPLKQRKLSDNRISACLETDELEGLRAYAERNRLPLTYALREMIRRGLSMEEAA
jgi:hypothetical protein